MNPTNFMDFIYMCDLCIKWKIIVTVGSAQ